MYHVSNFEFFSRIISKGFFLTFNNKSNRPFRPRFTCDFQIVHVICQIHHPYKGYFCPERLLRKSSNEKRSDICIREQFVTRKIIIKLNPGTQQLQATQTIMRNNYLDNIQFYYDLLISILFPLKDFYCFLL